MELPGVVESHSAISGSRFGLAVGRLGALVLQKSSA
jgi:hypothetical protein